MGLKDGRSTLRVEDQRFLTGKGRYTDDIRLDSAARAVFVRSPHAHARIGNIETDAAAAAPGILGIFSASDLAADGVGHQPCLFPVTGKGGMDTVVPPCPLLAEGKALYVGDPVVLVVAETLEQAKDAADLVDIDYDTLPSVTDTQSALDPGTPELWPDAPGNLALDWEIGDDDAVSDAFADATHTVHVSVASNRIAVHPLEPRSAVADYDAEANRYVLTLPSQGVHGVRTQLADHILKVEPTRVQVITPDAGGGFGARGCAGREQAATLWAAKRLGRPVHWTADRSECFFADGQARDHFARAEMALDADGRFLALRVSDIANMGGYIVDWGTSIPTEVGCEVLTGAYRIAAAHANVKCVFTNMCPTHSYRGNGRAEFIYFLERLVGACAQQLGIPPHELRRRNLIAPTDLPYTSPTAQVYDSGDFSGAMATAIQMSEQGNIRDLEARATGIGRLIGTGMSFYVMSAAGLMNEHARLRLDDDGGLSAFIGTQSTGQGHETAYTQLIAERFGIAPGDIRIKQGDSGICPPGAGTAQSRSLLMGGLALDGAADLLIERARSVASQLLQASKADLMFEDGAFALSGTAQRVSFAEIADAFKSGDAGQQPLECSYVAEQAPMTFPYGCHICKLAVDLETGKIDMLSYSIADDFGRLLNPMLCEGQVHGGVVQGIGQAMLEHLVYETDSGQLLSGSLMDYCLPRADDVPTFDVNLSEETPCLTNPMGVKGSGEAGAVAAPPAVINALLNALAPLGVRHIDMPATPERVWRAIRDAKS